MVLKVESLHKNFGTTKALNGMSFSTNPGEIFGFVGSNGAGKTTTMRIMLGVLKADSGQVTNNGKVLDFETRRNFGYMPEERGLYPRMKVYEQLKYLATLHGLDSKTAAQTANHWLERLGISARRNDVVQALSLGNQQRVQLAAALVHNPEFLVLDEPFSGLDPVAVDTMSEVLRERAREGATIIFSSHQLDLVERLCDRIGICSQGAIVSEGTIEELRQTEHRLVDLLIDADSLQVRNELSILGVQSSELRSGELRLELPNDVEEQIILRRLLELGNVRSFSPYRPHLVELFSNVVVAPKSEAEEEQPKKRGLSALFGKKK
ncbi:MAG: ATP-binding cassette domain-containing protein [Arcanobacterium sp.]|nr:ATP-binding cassette domain-containing protein [Arcanobacterium sp.]